METYDDIYQRIIENSPYFLVDAFKNFMEEIVTVDGREIKMRALLEEYANILAEDPTKIFEVEETYKAIYSKFYSTKFPYEDKFENTPLIARKGLRYANAVRKRLVGE